MSNEIMINGLPLTTRRIIELSNYSVLTVLQENKLPMSIVDIAAKACMSLDAATETVLRLHAEQQVLPLESQPVLWTVPI